MTVAPLSSTIVAVGLIPVAFLFFHAFLSGRKKNRFHPVSAVLAISWDLILSIGYMMYRTFRRGSGWLNFEVNSNVGCLFWRSWCSCNCSYDSWKWRFSAMGLSMLRQKAPNRWHPKLTKILFRVWWFAFLSGEIVYIALYLL